MSAISVACFAGILGSGGCQREGSEALEVIVYTSVDQEYATRVFDLFAEKTGVSVRAVFDTEAGKTTGLYRRLMAERRRPRADVFWNNEICRTIQIAEAGLAKDISDLVPQDLSKQWLDPDGCWAAFSLRARVIVYNTNLLKPEDVPKSLQELAEEKWRGKVVMANPLFGTTASHMAALYLALGDEGAESFLLALKANDVRLVEGNSVVRDVVARGEMPLGLTDTDDVFAGIQDGMPIALALPDQDGIGTFTMPNSVAIIAGGPNPETARMFVQFLLTPEVEALLAHGRPRQIPVRAEVSRPPELTDLADLRPMDVDYRQVAARMPKTARDLERIFLR